MEPEKEDVEWELAQTREENVRLAQQKPEYCRRGGVLGGRVGPEGDYCETGG